MGVSVLELVKAGSEVQKVRGYKLTKRLGKPARAYNDPALGEKAPLLIAHDHHQHGFAEHQNPNYDELIAIGSQWFSIPEFIHAQGGLGDFIGFQLDGLARSHNGWYEWPEIGYKGVNPECRALIEDNWQEIVDQTNKYLLYHFLDFVTGTYTFKPLQTYQKVVKERVIKLFSKGYNYSKRVYKTRERANETYYAIADALRPYVSEPTEDSPVKLYLHVNIKKNEVKVHG